MTNDDTTGNRSPQVSGLSEALDRLVRPRSDLAAPPHLARREPPNPEPSAPDPRPGSTEPWSLEVVGTPGRAVHVGRRGLIVGRVMGGLTVDDPFVSEGHASFSVRSGVLTVEDGGAPSGVFVSLPALVVLEPGHIFALGLQVFRYLGELEPPPAPMEYGAPRPARAFKVEHLLVGGRSGQVSLFRSSFTVGRSEGTRVFADDELLDPLHAELRPAPEGMLLVTHSRRWPVFVRLPVGAEVPLAAGMLVRIGTATLRVISNR